MTHEHVSYSRYPDPHMSWRDPASFAAGFADRPGLHRVDVGGPQPLDVLVPKAIPPDQQVLPVFLSAAVQDRDRKQGPFFSGVQIIEQQPWAGIAVADPAVTHSPTVGLAWYAGSQQTATQAQLVHFFEALSGSSGRELVFIGGSGAGFAALLLASRLGERASAVVWNPQTAISAYAPDSVRQFLLECWSAPSAIGELVGQRHEQARSALTAWMSEQRVSDSATDAARPHGRRLLYLQNATDWHVQAHMAPFLDSNGFRHVGYGMYRTDVNHVVQLADMGSGHAAPNPAVVASAISMMLDPACTAIQVRTKLVDMAIVAVPGGPQLPQDLRSDAAKVFDSLSLRVGAPDAQGNYLVTLAGFSSLAGRPTCAFTVDRNGERILRRGAGREHSFGYHAQTGDVVTWHVRDGFGHQIVSHQHTIDSLEPVPVRRQAPILRVLISGSCVSRDGFTRNAGEPALVDYYARSSLVSGFLSAPVPLDAVELERNPSPFQRRMVERDFSKDLKRELQSAEFDVLLLDLIDERFEIGVTHDGAMYTRSPELSRAGYPETARVIEAWSEERFGLFVDAWHELLRVIPAHRVLVNQAYWATMDKHGEPLRNAEEAHRANTFLTRLYALARATGTTVLPHSEHAQRTDPDHKWGPANFHYVPEFYDELMTALADSGSAVAHHETALVSSTSETIFVDTEQASDIRARYVAKYLDCLRSIALSDGFGDHHHVHITYCSIDKTAELEVLSAEIGALNTTSSITFLLVPYRHPAEGYGPPANSHVDSRRLPNKLAPRRDRLYAEALRALGVTHGADRPFLRFAIDDDDQLLPWTLGELHRMASQKLAREPSRLHLLGSRTVCVLYPDRDGQLDLVRIRPAVTGAKLVAGTDLRRVWGFSPWAIPEIMDRSCAERYAPAGVNIGITNDTLPLMVYVRSTTSLTVEDKSHLYVEMLATSRCTSEPAVVAQNVREMRAAIPPLDAHPIRFEVDPRALEASGSYNDGVLTIDCNVRAYLHERDLDPARTTMVLRNQLKDGGSTLMDLSGHGPWAVPAAGEGDRLSLELRVDEQREASAYVRGAGPGLV